MTEFKKGDVVRVIGKTKTEDLCGWPTIMDRCYSSYGEVSRVTQKRPDISVSFPDLYKDEAADTWNFHPDDLMLARVK